MVMAILTIFSVPFPKFWNWSELLSAYSGSHVSLHKVNVSLTVIWQGSERRIWHFMCRHVACIAALWELGDWGGGRGSGRYFEGTEFLSLVEIWDGQNFCPKLQRLKGQNFCPWRRDFRGQNFCPSRRRGMDRISVPSCNVWRISISVPGGEIWRVRISVPGGEVWGHGNF